MFCPRCGAQNPLDATQCSQCGTALNAAQGAEQAPQTQPQQPQQPQQPAQGPYAAPQQPPYTPPQAPYGQQQAGPYGAPQMPVSPMAPPVNLTMNWVLAAVSALCCCLPLGIAGIVFTAQANTKIAQQDYAGAADLAKKANLFSAIGIGVGAVMTIGYVILMTMSGMSGLR